MAIAFKAETHVATSSDTVTINKPAGTVDGDLMLLLKASSSDLASFTPPAGWLELGRISGASPPDSVVYYRFASSEPANYSVGGLGGLVRLVHILAYSGVTTTAFGGAVTNFGGPLDPVSIPNVGPNDFGIVFSSVTAGTAGRTITPPAGFTTRLNQNLDDGAGTFLTTVVSDKQNGGTPGTTTTTGGSFTALSVGLLVPSDMGGFFF